MNCQSLLTCDVLLSQEMGQEQTNHFSMTNQCHGAGLTLFCLGTQMCQVLIEDKYVFVLV